MNISLSIRHGLILLACWCGVVAAPAQTITWRVSVKFILDARGNRPTNGAINTNTKVQGYIDYGNWVLARFGRGYRMQLTEITNVANQSVWFNANAAGDGTDANTTGDPTDLKNAVKNSFDSGVNAFLFDPAAINIYIVNGNTAGSCPCDTETPQPGELIVLSQGINPDWVVLHESGHFLGLPHTHFNEKNQNADGTACTNGCSCAVLLPGDDQIADTLPDHDCWDTANQIATNNFNGRRYNALTPPEQLLVNNTLSNIMSYHGSSAAPRDATTGAVLGPADRYILTSDQMDRVTDVSNGSRNSVASGNTWFVDRTNTAESPAGNSQAVSIPLAGLFFGPFPTLQSGVAAAGGNDIVIIRPGTYTDTTRFDKAMSLRATRGNATLRAN